MKRLTWADRVKEKDGYKCVMCGSTKNLHAHHVKPAFLYPECKTDIDNGVTLCKDCHQNQHNGHFAGYKVFPVNGINPDPENRMEEYRKKRSEECSEENKYRSCWHTSKINAKILYEAAKAAGVNPQIYIAEAVSMRLKAEGFDHDERIFVEPHQTQK